jgi:hypothetical protein
MPSSFRLTVSVPGHRTSANDRKLDGRRHVASSGFGRDVGRQMGGEVIEHAPHAPARLQVSVHGRPRRFGEFRFTAIGRILSSSRRSTSPTKEEIMNRTALIIGATGGIGSEIARALIAAGWTVRGLHRNPTEAARRFAWIGPVDWTKGDAMNAAQAVSAAEGMSLVVHAANPAG